MTQEIILYRNPLEQQIWHSVMGGEFFPVFVGIVCFFAIFLTANIFIEKFVTWQKRVMYQYIALAASAVAGVFVTATMVI